LRVAVTVRTCVLDDAERARDIARRQLAFMIGAYGPYYRQSIAEQGFADATDGIHEAWAEGDRGEASAAVTDEMVDRLVAVGTEETAESRLNEYAAIDGVDAVRLGFFGDMTAEDRRRTIEAMAP
jgi:alkanesulfonate monooxygenase SsuD/methylene tetrahydromethanopterin reductase-like flavin-dependent oxidoreductase (luciferase family)